MEDFSFLTKQEIERIIYHLEIKLAVIEKHKAEIEADQELKLVMEPMVSHIKKAISFWEAEMVALGYVITMTEQEALQ